MEQQNRNTRKPTPSASMIVKNEERFLPQCLGSIKNAVDEIIIVDTGSTDKTVEIAESFGAKIYHHPWRNSFSEARNHSLNYATCDWILQIDADETLEEEDIPLLRKIICSNSFNAFYVAIYSELQEGLSKHYFTRLFRRGTAHYEGIVHNQLVHKGDATPSEVRLYHYGYNLPQDEMNKKLRPTEELLKKQLEENPEDIFALANLVRTYRNEGNYDEVITLAEKGLEISGEKKDAATINQRQRISVDLAIALVKKKNLDKAEKICKDALKEEPTFLDNLFILGDVLGRKKAYYEALDCYKKFLVIKEKERKSPNFNLLIVDTYDHEHKVYNNIGECYRNLGLLRDAEKSYKKAIELDNKEPLCYTSLVRLYSSQNRFVEATSTIDTAIRLGAANYLTYLLLGEIQMTQKKFSEAIDSFKESIRKNKKNVKAYVHLLNLLIKKNRLKEAEGLLQNILSFYPDNFSLKCLGEKIKYKKGDKEGAINFVRNIISSNPSGAMCLDLGNLCLELQEYPMAIDLLERFLRSSSVPDARALTNIAICYAKQGRIKPAILGLKTALKIDPSCRYALQNLTILEKRLQSA